MARPLPWDKIRQARLLRDKGETLERIAQLLGAANRATALRWLAVEGEGPPPEPPPKKTAKAKKPPRSRPRPKPAARDATVHAEPEQGPAPQEPPARIATVIQLRPKSGPPVLPVRGKASDGDVVQLLLDAIEAGAGTTEACAMVGISPRTLVEWQKKAASGDRQYIEIGDRIAIAVAIRKRNLLRRIEEMGAELKDWRALAWVHQRRHPEEFGPAAAKELALDGPWAPGEEEAGPLPEVPQGPAVGTLAHTLELLHQRRAVAQDPAGLAAAEG